MIEISSDKIPGRTFTAAIPRGSSVHLNFLTPVHDNVKSVGFIKSQFEFLSFCSTVFFMIYFKNR